MDQVILSAGFEARLIALIGWILKPTIQALPDPYKLAGNRLALEARLDALNTAAGPLLAPFLADPRAHGIAGSIKGFRAFYELTHIERELVCALAATPKNRYYFNSIREPWRTNSIYSDAELIACAESLRLRGWCEFLGPEHFQPGSKLEQEYLAGLGTVAQQIRRGKLLSGLSCRELLFG